MPLSTQPKTTGPRPHRRADPPFATSNGDAHKKALGLQKLRYRPLTAKPTKPLYLHKQASGSRGPSEDGYNAMLASLRVSPIALVPRLRGHAAQHFNDRNNHDRPPLGAAVMPDNGNLAIIHTDGVYLYDLSLSSSNDTEHFDFLSALARPQCIDTPPPHHLPFSNFHHSATGRICHVTDNLQRLRLFDAHNTMARIDDEAAPIYCPIQTSAHFCAQDKFFVHQQLNGNTAVQELLFAGSGITLGSRHTLPGGPQHVDIVAASSSLQEKFLVVTGRNPPPFAPPPIRLFERTLASANPWALKHTLASQVDLAWALGTGQDMVAVTTTGSIRSVSLTQLGMQAERHIPGTLRAIDQASGCVVVWRAQVGKLMLVHGGYEPLFADVDLAAWCSHSRAIGEQEAISHVPRLSSSTKAIFSATGDSLALIDGHRLWVIRDIMGDVKIAVPRTGLAHHKCDSKDYPWGKIKGSNDFLFDQGQLFVFALQTMVEGSSKTKKKMPAHPILLMYGLVEEQGYSPKPLRLTPFAEQTKTLQSHHSQLYPPQRPSQPGPFWRCLLPRIWHWAQQLFSAIYGLRYTLYASKSHHMWPF